jgi:hypothetical protein
MPPESPRRLSDLKDDGTPQGREQVATAALRILTAAWPEIGNDAQVQPGGASAETHQSPSKRKHRKGGA